MTRLILEPPCALISANDRLHFRAKAKLTSTWRTHAEMQATIDRCGYWTKPVHITVLVRFPTNHRRDVGNYYPTAKAIVDGLVDAGVLPDDNDDHLTGPDLRRERPNGPLRVTVTIEEAA